MALNSDKLTSLIKNGQDAQDLAVNILLPFHESFLYGMRYFLVTMFFIAASWTLVKYFTEPEKASIFRLGLVVALGLAMFQTTTVTTIQIEKDAQQYDTKVEGYELLAEDFIFNHLKTNESYEVSAVMWFMKTIVDSFESILYGVFDKAIQLVGGGSSDIPYELYSSISMNSAQMMGDDNMRKIYLHHHMCGNLLAQHIRERDNSINMDAMRGLGYNSGMLGMLSIKDAHPPLSDSQLSHVKLLESGGYAKHDTIARQYLESNELKSYIKTYIGYLKNICPLNSGECLSNWTHQNSYVFFELPSAKYWYNQFVKESGEPSFKDSLFGVFKNEKKQLQAAIKNIPTEYYINDNPKLMANPNVTGQGPSDDPFGNPQTGRHAPSPTGLPLNDSAPTAGNRFYPQTCHDTYTLTNLYWKEFRKSASLFYDIPLTGKHEKRSIVKENITSLALATLNKQAQISESGYRHQFLGQWTGHMDDDDTDILESIEESGMGMMLEVWTWLQEYGVKYLVMFTVGGIAFLIGIMVVGFPLVALFSVLPNRLSALTQYLQAYIFLKVILFIYFVFIKLGTLIGAGLRLFMTESVKNGFGYVNNVAILTYVVDAALVLGSTYGAFKIAYFIVFNEDHGLKSLDFSGFGAGQAAKTTTSALASAGLITTLGTKLGSRVMGGITKSLGSGSVPSQSRSGTAISPTSGSASSQPQRTMKEIKNSVQSPLKDHPGNSKEPFKKG